APHAWAGPWRAAELVESADVLANPEALGSGWWFVVGDFSGRVHGWRFADVQRVDDERPVPPPRPWRGPSPSTWRSSLDQQGYVDAVAATREAIAAGKLEQVNLCRVLSAPLGARVERPSAGALADLVAAHHPATYACGIDVPADSGHREAWLVSASPERFLGVQGTRVSAAPVKGTAPRPELLVPKDYAESRLVAEAMRAELAPLCVPSTARVAPGPLVEELPGLVQLVAPVTGELPEPPTGHTWRELFQRLLPPMSVAGVPRPAALAHIADLEPVERGPYCGMAGWIDADRGEAELGVTIRSFWWESPTSGQAHGTLRFGTGAGITYDSDPEREWHETQLKAERLLSLASDALDVDRAVAP
ncbi:MAG TPA: chorismate-binding protein, partial [Actinomycetaceae bacterium]|nr:chorismate-binding protein [Actinomycetaceae bacterium]